MKWYIKVLKNYAVFSGRARRKEYWMFALFNIIVSFVLGFMFGFIEGMLGGSGIISNILLTIYSIAVLLPAIAVGVRRMHDTDHRGWWLLFPLVNLLLAVREGQRSDNRFGPDPKATTIPA